MRWLPSPLANVWLRRATRRRVERRLWELRKTPATFASPVEWTWQYWYYIGRES